VNPRELLQSAQAAEREGDLARAVALLEQAARIYEETGHPSRAAQMRRHAGRLLGGEPPEESSLALLASAASAAGAPDSEPRWDLGPGLVERTPTLADPALEAWCSFCCRPAREVGPLVAGPAQAFVCQACIELAAGLLGTAPASTVSSGSGDTPPAGSTEGSTRSGATAAGVGTSGASAGRPVSGGPGTGQASGSGNGARISTFVAVRPVDAPVLPRRLSGRALEALRTQRSAVQRIEEELSAGHATRVLLVGATGSGKSTWLRHWAERGLGTAWEGSGPLPETGAVLVDDVDRLEAPARRLLARALESRSVVLTLDATLPAPGKEIDGRRVHGSDEVDSVAGDWLPGSVLDGLILETFELPGPEELRTLADRWRAPDGSGATREAREEALRLAEVSTRSAHALHALLLRWWASR
jgi:hypothetical protein